MAGKNKNTALALGVGLAAAAAGALFLYGKSGAKTKKKVRGWALKAKGEVLEQLENLGEVTEASYGHIVDEVAKKYANAKNVDKSELLAMAKELKSHWRSISRELGGKAKKAKSAVSRAVAPKKKPSAKKK